jgi:hypothetical protein
MREKRTGKRRMKTKTLFKADPDVLFRDLEGEAVLLHLESGTYFGLNETGTLLWDLLKKPRSPEELANALAGEFEVSEAQAKKDVSGLLSELKSHKLVKEAVL